MIEILIAIILLLLILLLKKPHNTRPEPFADEKRNNPQKQSPNGVVGESRFVMDNERKNQKKISEPSADSSGKMHIEVPLDYETKEPNNQEVQEDLEMFGLHNDYSKNITFEEMMAVVNEVGNHQSQSTPKTGKLLYENENTDWVEQLASSSENNANRIAALIDLHLERLERPNSDGMPVDGLMGFDIGEYVG